ncbi:DUF2057 family protein [Vibrio hannami]|uniref:DUF2057 family protein n=1 Tax=Vibrio hannami TaxID=2717094 RepID=UPI0024102990|nr:DUF2057 family protein [Vibrio hannami]MDG3088243.1 DUF2057 family protein [Vibrio hannami]
MLLLSFSVTSAELSVPRTVDVLAINGVQVKEKEHYTLNAGENQLVIRYAQVLKKGSLKKQFESKPYVVSVSVINQSSDYRITHKRFLNYSAAEAAFKNDKAGWVLETDNGSIMLETVELPGNPGFMPYQDIEKAVANYNQQAGIEISDPVGDVQKVVEVKKDVVKPTPAVVESSASVSSVAVGSNSAEFVKDIQSWYLNASDEERKSLLKWMIEQQ